MIKTTGLAATHMECRNLKESMAVMIDLLAFEKISEKPARRRSNIPTPIGCWYCTKCRTRRPSRCITTGACEWSILKKSIALMNIWSRTRRSTSSAPSVSPLGATARIRVISSSPAPMAGKSNAMRRSTANRRRRNDSAR